MSDSSQITLGLETSGTVFGTLFLAAHVTSGVIIMAGPRPANSWHLLKGIITVYSLEMQSLFRFLGILVMVAVAIKLDSHVPHFCGAIILNAFKQIHSLDVPVDSFANLVLLSLLAVALQCGGRRRAVPLLFSHFRA
ncbi:hypothetical protein [Asticcacaulis sp.]|uniref:hypothetical protein n=1 Tax=Asticcacaulis sp. TaxID=1872648 RepID=UPI003F7CCBA3